MLKHSTSNPDGSHLVTSSASTKPNYGIDAPAVMRNLFLAGALCLLIAIFAPRFIRLGPISLVSRSFFWPAGFLLAEGFLFLLYVKIGKFHHRDFMLSLHTWRGDENVLDVGCGRSPRRSGKAPRRRQWHWPRHRYRCLVKRRYGRKLCRSHPAQS
jgi:arsenite methyltransferase